MLQQLRNKIPFFSAELSTNPDAMSMWQYVLLGVLTFLCCYYGIASYAILDMNEGTPLLAIEDGDYAVLMRLGCKQIDHQVEARAIAVAEDRRHGGHLPRGPDAGQGAASLHQGHGGAACGSHAGIA